MSEEEVGDRARTQEDTVTSFGEHYPPPRVSRSAACSVAVVSFSYLPHSLQRDMVVGDDEAVSRDKSAGPPPAGSANAHYCVRYCCAVTAAGTVDCGSRQLQAHCLKQRFSHQRQTCNTGRRRRRRRQQQQQPQRRGDQEGGRRASRTGESIRESACHN